MKLKRNLAWTSGLMALVATNSVLGQNTIKNPDLVAISVGSEAPSWSWKLPPTAIGEYDPATGVYTLTGNGQAVYFCWDRAAFAFISAAELTGDFTLTARVAEMPAAGPGQIGMMVKSSLDTRAPVLSLRWDYYWQDNGGVGLTWFNRLTPPEKIGMHDKGEKGDMQGTEIVESWKGRGCLGLGFENRVPGFDKREDLWLKIKREGVNYKMFAKYGSGDNWVAVDPTEQMGTKLEAFTLPAEGVVFAGLFVLGVGYGDNMVTAKFDNIELINEASADPVVSVAGVPDPTLWKAYRTDGGVNLVLTGGNRSPELQSVDLFDLSGKRIKSLRGAARMTGNQLFIPAGENLKSGLYWLKLRVAGEGEKVIPVVELRN